LGGLRFTKNSALAIFVLAIVSCVCADYIRFRVLGPFVDTATGSPVGYAHYFHAKATSWAFQPTLPLPATQLGMVGYYFAVMGILGFAGAILIVPLWRADEPYCEACGRYLRKRRLGLWPTTLKQSEASSEFSRDTNWEWAGDDYEP